jgi:hypothetical protein
VDGLTNEELQILNAIGVPFFPSRHFMKDKNDILRFTLIFPAIPKHWKVFHFMEKAGAGSLYSYNIWRNNSGVYKVQVS